MFSGVIRKMNSEIGEDTATLADTKSSGFNLHIISKYFLQARTSYCPTSNKELRMFMSP